jgi:hypothetical protein
MKLIAEEGQREAVIIEHSKYSHDYLPIAI